MTGGYAAFSGCPDFGAAALDALEDVEAADLDAVSATIGETAKNHTPSRATWILTSFIADRRFQARTLDEDGTLVETSLGGVAGRASFQAAWPPDLDAEDQARLQRDFVADLQGVVDTGGGAAEIVEAVHRFFVEVSSVSRWVNTELDGALMARNSESQVAEKRFVSDGAEAGARMRN